MSKVKIYLENLADLTANAIYDECFDMPDYLEWTHEDVLEDMQNAFFKGDYDSVFNAMFGWFENYQVDEIPERMPLSFSACCALLPWISSDLKAEWTELFTTM